MRANASRGFSFIELLASLAIIATLLAIAVPVAQSVVKRKQEAELRLALGQIRGAIDQYKRAVDAGRIATKSGATGYPPDLAVLASGVDDVSSPSGAKIYFLRRVPADPFSESKTSAPEETWGLRSYASPPDDPQAGEDVFDVYSTSTENGLNDVPYREW
ncbi:type II secretion system protein [Pseudoxanthomonas wuyuanensis]|uniref:General secretion pathway protein G n=1 Tax=Pseudoxanthomonas wuyuanensis TaxID=1073196 RepID=A0A286CYY8_9GAMM|nr:type II secretion system protein [Pseudoxanthomonas wuyuanensis]KAF1722241.1 type II secretion system protein [Pseudoxanthomonas wuyuanensis]SOD51623.1 general secretion pathway protein G [Pseudoxanthomonas wuyuanensis]